MSDFLTFHFELALFIVTSEEDDKSDNANENQSDNGSASNARCFQHHTRPGCCLGGEKSKNKEISEVFLMKLLKISIFVLKSPRYFWLSKQITIFLDALKSRLKLT